MYTSRLPWGWGRVRDSYLSIYSSRGMWECLPDSAKHIRLICAAAGERLSPERSLTAPANTRKGPRLASSKFRGCTRHR